jgi:Ca2+:H+ antiporter
VVALWSKLWGYQWLTCFNNARFCIVSHYKDSTLAGPYNSEKTTAMLDSPSQSEVPQYSNTTPPASEAHSAQPIMHGNKSKPLRGGFAESSQGTERTTGERAGSTSHPGASSRHTSALSRQLSHIRRKTVEMFVPPRPVGQPPSPLQSLRAIITASYLNLLLVFIPLSWALHFALPESMSSRDTIIFVTSFLAIIPLAKLLGFATEELSLRVGQTLAGLLNATLGNAVELIVAILALVKCQLQVVQSSLIGSILSNLLLVLGMCFFAGGLKYSEQGFGVSATQLNSSLLTISVIAVLLPAAFDFSTSSRATDGPAILALSHGVAIILLFIYAAYLFFQLYSHPDLYVDNGEHNIITTNYKGGPKFYIPKKISNKMHLHHHLHKLESANNKRGNDVEVGSASGGSGIIDNSRPLVSSPHIQGGGGPDSLELDPMDAQTVGETTARSNTLAGSVRRNRTVGFEGPEDPQLGRNGTIPESTTGSHTEEEAEEEEPMMSMWMTVILLVVVTVVVAITAEFLVDSIDGLVEHGGISKEFVGLILLPIVGNAAEHVTAVTVSVKDKLNLSLGVAVGSSIVSLIFRYATILHY